MDIDVKWRGFGDNPKGRLLQLLNKSCKKFFQYYHGMLSTIQFTAFKAERGVDGGTLIKVAAYKSEYTNYPGGVPVMVHLEGNQGLRCLMFVPGKTPEEVRTLVTEGPYNTKPRVECVDQLHREGVQMAHEHSDTTMAPSVVEVLPQEVSTDDCACDSETASIAQSIVTTSRFTSGWFNDKELVKTLLSAMLERFVDGDIALRDEFTKWLKDMTNFARAIDVGLLVRQLLLGGFIKHPTEIMQSGDRPQYYKIERKKIQAYIDADTQTMAEDDKKKLRARLLAHWKDPVRLKQALFLLCDGYPDGRYPSAVGLTKYAAGADKGSTFVNLAAKH